jgi:hypothetical protein
MSLPFLSIRGCTRTCGVVADLVGTGHLVSKLRVGVIPRFHLAAHIRALFILSFHLRSAQARLGRMPSETEVSSGTVDQSGLERGGQPSRNALGIPGRAMYDGDLPNRALLTGFLVWELVPLSPRFGCYIASLSRREERIVFTLES